MSYIRSIQRTPISPPGGIQKNKKTVELASIVASGLEKTSEIDTLIMGASHGEGLAGRAADQICSNCKFPATIEAILVLDGERAGLRSLELCVQKVESGASCTMALAAISVSNLPYLLPDARRGRRMGSSKALDPLLLGDIPKPMGTFTGQDKWFENALQITYEKHKLGMFKNEIIGEGGDEFLENPVLMRSVPNLSQIMPLGQQMAPLGEGACGVLLESHPTDQTLAEILGIIIKYGETGDCRSTLEALGEVTGFDPSQADRINVVDPCASHPLRFIGNAGIKDASIVNAFGGALAMGYMPGAAGLHALTMLVHGLQSRQIGLCFQFGDGWSAGVLVKRMP